MSRRGESIVETIILIVCIFAIGAGISVLMIHYMFPSPAKRVPVKVAPAKVDEPTPTQDFPSPMLVPTVNGYSEAPFAPVYNADAIDKVARVLYIEARGEKYRGKVGTAAVMWERGDGDIEQIAQAVTSLDWNGREGLRLLRTTRPDKKSQAWKDCYAIAESVADRTYTPPFKVNMVHSLKRKPASWKGARFVCKIGKQKFYYNPRLS